jgi:hypothetical protein
VRQLRTARCGRRAGLLCNGYKRRP